MTDITYIRLRSRFLYLAVMLDAWSRKVVQVATASKRIDVNYGAVTLNRACKARAITGIIHHSDQGAQYHAKSYQLKLAEYGMVGSMSRKTTPTDNPQVESFYENAEVYEEVYQFGYETNSNGQQRLPKYLSKRYTIENVFTRRSDT